MAERVAGTYDTTRTGYDPARTGDVAVAVAGRRISWGAVFAGVIIVLIVQLVLSLLGVGIGASTIDPSQRGGTPEASTFGIGAGLWWVICSLISVFAGAWVAGRLAGMPDRTDGMLHGLVAWGLAMLLLIYLLTTAVSSLVGGAFGVVGSAMQTAGQGAQAAAGAATDAARTPGLLAPFQQDLQQLLGQARQQAQQAGQQIQQITSDENVRSARQDVALQAIFAYNFKPSLWEHANPQRPGYAIGDEAGLLLCTWPRGGKPTLPFVYSDEVWTGIEYQVASHLIARGLLSEGLTIVKAVRERYDGRKRNPWNEYECGNYYARAMASYALLIALSGFRYSAPGKTLTLAPQLDRDPFECFFSTASGWGSFILKGDRLVIRLVEGTLAVDKLCCTRGGKTVTLTPNIVARAGKRVEIHLT